MLLVTCVHLGPEEAGKKQYKLFYDVGMSFIAYSYYG